MTEEIGKIHDEEEDEEVADLGKGIGNRDDHLGSIAQLFIFNLKLLGMKIHNSV